MSETKRSNSNQTPWEQGDSDVTEFGPWLRQQREVREITLREISEASKISLRYLEAMEEDRFDLLPAPVFAKGFLRQYARYVGLDADEVVNRYIAARQLDPDTSSDDETGPDATLNRVRRSKRDDGRGAGWKMALVALSAIVLLALGIWLVPKFLGGDDEAAEPPPGVAATDQARDDADAERGPDDRRAMAEPEEEEELAAPLVVDIDFQADSWVEAKVDGETQVSEMRVQGESLHLEAEETLEITLGNAGGVTIERNGEPYPLDAESGSVRTITLQAPARAGGGDGDGGDGGDGNAAAG